MSEQPILLDDKAMHAFIRQGYVTVQADMPDGYHESLCAKLDTILPAEGNPGNNLLPRVPEIQHVFEHPAVRGALTSILGPNYVMHPHRYGHGNVPGSKAQYLHKDATHYSGDKDIRDHRCRWAMAFYYPHDVTEDMGPTSILPGTQYYETLSTDPDNAELFLCGKAGTVNIVHFDVWHRATANLSNTRRYMLKFIFQRTEEPTSPEWDNVNLEWQGAEDEKHALLWRSHWNWLRGEREQNLTFAPILDAAIANAVAELAANRESVALNAAYALGAVGPVAIPALLGALSAEEEQTRSLAALALSLIGKPAVPALLHAACHPNEKVRVVAVDALAETTPPTEDTLATLIRALQDEDSWVRRHAADALGTLGPNAAEATDALAKLLQDEKPYVRINAATALMKLGPAAAEAVPALGAALWDSDRYTQGFAALALRRIGTQEATEVLLEHLMHSRWCPITNVKTPY